MSRTKQDRIDDALSQLVERSIAVIDGEDEAESDERYYRALDTAKDTIDQIGPATHAQSAAHISDAVQRRLIREHANPDAALRFANLYNRLLAQPVLNQKSAILHLLNELSEAPQPQLQSRSRSFPETQNRLPPAPTPAPTAPPAQKSLDEAFSRNGLIKQPDSKASRPAPQYPPFNPRDHPRRHNDEAHGLSPEQEAEIERRLSGAAPTEAALLRDVPFLLQGISSTNFYFTTAENLKMPQKLPAPLIALLHALAEPALLYRRLAAFVESSEGGLVGQSLRSAVSAELRSYLGLVATLESQIRRALSQLDEVYTTRRGLGVAGVTLKRCVIWTREATMGLRLMNVIVEESQSRKGGQLISLIHSFSSSHGDPFVSAFAERLLSHVTRPFYDMLRPWIYDGELSDPYQEFFVSEQYHPDAEVDSKGATSVWEDKYKLDKEMIPSIVTEDFARKVFLIGKSLNFIRYGCCDSAWVESYSRETSKELHYGDTALLESSIDSAYETTMARLTWLMNEKFNLQSHLLGLKRYLLLGQGDFVALLMESLASALDRPATSQYRHALTAQLEHAIRGSNAQYESEEVLRRLDARMLELSHGEVGWDVFTLEYKIDAPVDVVVTPHGSKQYLKVFNFLWRVKRVEYALGTTWRRSMTGARSVLSHDRTGPDWKAARCALAEMIHFVNQLQYYILFEVIESSWAALQRDMHRPGTTLDDLIAAHARYLRAITRKGLLTSAGHLDFPGQLHELLKLMLAYAAAVDALYAHSLSRQARRDPIPDDNDTDEHDPAVRRPRSRDVDSPLPPPLIALDGNDGPADVQGALRARLAALAADFRAKITALLGDLAYQPDMELRFLGVVMNFNDTYKVVRRSRRARTGVVEKEATQGTARRRTDGVSAAGPAAAKRASVHGAAR